MECINSPRNPTNQDAPKSVCNYIKIQHTKKVLEKLPSPRELAQVTADEDDENEDALAVPQKRLVSISELNPIFEELDYASSTSSTSDEVVELYRKGSAFLPNAEETLDINRSLENEIKPTVTKSNIKCKRTSSFRQIWSSLGSTTLPGLPVAAGANSQESFTSSSGKSDGKKSLKNRLKKVSSKVRKQFSTTGNRFNNVRMETDSEVYMQPEGNDEVWNGDVTIRNKTKRSGTTQKDFYGESCNRSRDAVTRVIAVNEDLEDLAMPIVQLECLKKRDLEAQDISGLLWSIPNWVPCMDARVGQTSLEQVIEEEKRRIAQKQPIEWAEAIEQLRRSVGKDFRRGYLALGEKMQLPNLQAIRCLKFSPFDSFLAIGCEEGTLLILELDFHKPLHKSQCSSSNENFQNPLHAGGNCRIKMNETLVGHAYDLRCIAWNNSDGKLITSDEIGVIIGWGFNEENCWMEEIINDRSTSMIRDMAWSPSGKKLVIGYEDYGENGCVTGGIVVTRFDGTQIFDRKFPDSQVNFVVWHNENFVWIVVNHTLYSFDEHGELGKMYRPLAMSHSGERVDLVSILLQPTNSWITSDRAPEFAVVYKDSCMSLHGSIADKNPVRVHTQVAATCADWSANGVYIAIGGMSIVPQGVLATPQVNLFNYEGKLLQILKLPEQMVTSVSWDTGSLHLSISTERHIYFANLRPMYKVSSCGDTHCYVYPKTSNIQCVTFWNFPATTFTEILPGKVIDIKSCNGKFAILLMDSLGVYHVLVFGNTGVQQKHLCIITMEPFTLAMTKNCIICLAPNAILNWNYNLGEGSESSRKFTGTLKATRQVHVDDFPAIIPKPGEKTEHLNKAVLDCARCMHAVRDQLCVAKESGKLQLYALPTLGFLQTFVLDLGGDICQQIMFNNDGTKLALLTMNGRLRICLFPQGSGQQLEIQLCESLTTISDMLWASDVPNLICALDRNSIHVLQDGKVLEGVSNIPSGCYLTNFEDLSIHMINMDRVIECTDNPATSMLLRLPTPSYTKILESLDNDDSVEDLLAVLSTLPYTHPVLNILIGNEALRQGNYAVAENMFTEEKNYAGVRFIEKMNEIEGHEVKTALSSGFLGDLDQAQMFFLRAGRKDLAVKMWKDVGNWDRVTFLSGHNSEDFTCGALENQYEICCLTQDWSTALKLANKLESAEKVMESCVMLEDHLQLLALADRLPLGDPMLGRIAKVLACDGLIDEAVQCFLNCGDPMLAMKTAMDTRNWDLAMKLSSVHNLPFIRPALVKHVRSLIDSNRLNPAIQVLERCGKTITAGKLLVWKGLRMLQVNTEKLMEVKKVFVLAARMLSRKNRVMKVGSCQPRNEGSNVKNNLVDDGEELDLEFLLPEAHLKVMMGHNEWCWSDPWRGAEAVHFLILVQHYIYSGMMGRAFRAAIHLKDFESIIGHERINSLVALTAINTGYFNVASNALLKLETEDDPYSSIPFSLFRDHAPVDHDVIRVPCPECRRNIPDFHSVCPLCNAKFIVCVFSASQIISNAEMWTCRVCLRHVELSKRDRFTYCVLCHSKVDD